jgi:hypothetical protein
MHKVGEALGDRPTARTMLCSNFRLVNWVAERTSGCERCRRFDALGQIQKLNVKIYDEVERVISKVRRT